MSITDSAFRTSDEAAIQAYHDFQAACIPVQHKRNALSEAEGRNLMVNRSGFGHGTRVVGFERFDSDSDGDLVSDGSLIVSKKRGQYKGIIVPHLARKSGKAYAEHLREYNTPDLVIPGMPSWHIGGHVEGMAVYAPALWVWPSGQDEVLFAFWSTNTVAGGVGEQWEEIPMSTYWLAKEQHDAALEAKKVSGNENTEDEN